MEYYCYLLVLVVILFGLVSLVVWFVNYGCLYNRLIQKTMILITVITFYKFIIVGENPEMKFSDIY